MNTMNIKMIQDQIERENKQSKKHKKFTPEEDKIIVDYVNQNGQKNWGVVASQLVDRTSRQVRGRYLNYLSPFVSRMPWSEYETQLLLHLVSRYGRKWAIFTRFFRNRTDINLKNHYANILKKNRRRDYRIDFSTSEEEKDEEKEKVVTQKTEEPENIIFDFFESEQLWVNEDDLSYFLFD